MMLFVVPVLPRYIGVASKGEYEMTTTFEKFANATCRNYCTLPTLDVEILPEVHHCKACGKKLTYDPKGGAYGWGEWVHIGDAGDCKYVSPRASCVYCRAEDGVTFHQRAWSDETECKRCGGVDGHPIGD